MSYRRESGYQGNWPCTNVCHNDIDCRALPYDRWCDSCKTNYAVPENYTQSDARWDEATGQGRN